MSYPLWALAELAICATDLAEVIGTAIGLNLLFGIPLEIGVLLTALDVFLILWMQPLGFRWVEAFVVTLFVVITVCFGIQIAMADPDWGQVIRGFAPTVEIVKNPEMLYLALGILGATVMPHNLYLHSGIVQTRRFGDSVPEKREAIKLATIDSTIALMFALLDQRLDPDPGRLDLPPAPARPTWPSSARSTSSWRRCSARRSRRPCSPSRCSPAGSTPR